MNSFFSFIGAADCYIDVLTDEGAATGLELKGNCTEFVPKPDSERKEQTATGRDNWGQVLGSVTLPRPMTCTIRFNQMDQSLFSMAFFGTTSALTQASGTISEAISVVTIPDKWVEIGKYMVSALVVKDSAEAITYVAGEHYEVNPRLGMIKAIAGAAGGIANGATVKITGGTFAAVAGSVTDLMTKSNVRIRVKLDGQNYADGRNFIADIYQLRLNPTSDISLVSEDFVDASFEGVLETPTDKSAPGKFVWLS